MTDAIDPKKCVHVGTVSERYQSYNIEMAEITGGRFWKPYTEAQVRGLEPFSAQVEEGDEASDTSEAFSSMRALTAPRPPVDLSGARVRTLARALGPVHVRVSGSWSAHTYFDHDGSVGETPPEGYHAVLTREQWDGLIDFARSVDATLVTSMANTAGAHHADGSWNPANSRAFLEYTLAAGLEVAGAEFMNEPDLAGMHGAPDGYTAQDYSRDLAIFEELLRDAAPRALFAGPGAVRSRSKGSLPSGMVSIAIDELMSGPAGMPDVFSYHFYCGLSERGGGYRHIPADQVLTEEYLGMTSAVLDGFMEVRNDYVPHAPVWLTETADAALGGDTWAPTWLDVPRYIDQLGRLARGGVQSVMHNTLCASDYGMLNSHTHEPRAKYWAAWFWAQFMGTEVYDPGIAIREGLHAYVHNRRNGSGYTAVLINNSRTNETVVNVPSGSEIYVLEGPELRGTVVTCNGEELQMVDDHTMPTVHGIAVSGDIVLPPVSITFVTIPA
jgi:hypothetical protein